MEFREEEYLLISGLQHFVFCRRQWALGYIDNQWQENYFTSEGHIIHERAHDDKIKETRGDKIIVRNLPIISHEYGIKGQCDVVEFHKDSNGVSLPGRGGKWRPYPVEYKRGKPKQDGSDKMQLLAQILCLEEMLVIPLTDGAVYYHEIRRREKYTFTEDDREELLGYLREMHHLMDRHHIPIVKEKKACKSCSLREICLPQLTKLETPWDYIRRMTET